MNDDLMAYIGLCKCGCLRFAAVDMPDKASQRFISRSTMQTLRSGGTVTRQSVAETREILKASGSECTCQKEVVQRGLFDDMEVQT